MDPRRGGDTRENGRAGPPRRHGRDAHAQACLTCAPVPRLSLETVPAEGRAWQRARRRQLIRRAVPWARGGGGASTLATWPHVPRPSLALPAEGRPRDHPRLTDNLGPSCSLLSVLALRIRASRFPDKDAGWISGEVTSKEVDEATDKIVLSFIDDKGKVSSPSLASLAVLLPGVACPFTHKTRVRSSRNPPFPPPRRLLASPYDQESKVEATVDTLTASNEALPPLKNPPLLESQEDLANLSNLNEPSG